MAKRQPKAIIQTKQPGQISAPGGEFLNYLYRIVPLWQSPLWWEAQRWRTFVQNQPIAVVFRDTLIAYLQALDWSIVPRDSTQQDELKEEIKYYTDLFTNTDGYYSEYDFSSHIEFIGKDLLDLPFGGASEFGRENDDPSGKVVWIRLLDGGTLAPTLNQEWPVMQRIPNYNVADPVFFPAENISRIFMSPRTELRREGWGMAPPEKIYLALELLWRGDKYYADLLLNTPEIGILDLGDMEQEDAEKWVKSFQDLLTGIDPFKIPVTYQHTTETKFISFGKLPNDIMFDNITRKYAAIVGASYGMTLDDIGISGKGGTGSGGETLAGAIRSERHTNKAGKAVVKKKFVSYFNKFLPKTLTFKWIDYDTEEQVAKGRARLANAQSTEILVRNQVFSPDEMRLQAIQDGLITISVPETLDRKSIEWPASGGSLGSNLLGKPQPASAGGHGETPATDKTVIRSDIVSDQVTLSKILSKAYPTMRIVVQKAKREIKSPDLVEWSDFIDKIVFGEDIKASEGLKTAINKANTAVFAAFSAQFSPVFEPNKDAYEVVSDLLRAESYDFMSKKVEEAFVLGKRNDISLTEEEQNEIENRVQTTNIQGLIDASIEKASQVLLDSVSNSAISILKSVLLKKLDIDAEKSMDDNKLEILDTASKQLAEVLPDLYDVANEAGIKFMKEEIDMEAKNGTRS